MIKKLKQSKFGKALYRLSRSPLGAPLRRLARLAQHERVQLTHLSRAHRQHNQKQTDVLGRFETQTGPSQ